MNIDSKNIAERIASIVEGRKARAAELRNCESQMRKIQSNLRRLSGKLSDTKAEIARIGANDSRSEAARKLCVDAIQSVGEIINDAVEQEKTVRDRLPHFTRDKFCVAEAGGTQAGKSTVLQKIVGMDGTDPKCPIVGGGSGMSTTAARCRIVNIEADERPHAIIYFFDRDEFVQKVVAPYANELRARGVPLPMIATLDDFESFDPDAFSRENGQSVDAMLANSQTAQQWLDRFLSLRRRWSDYSDLIGSGSADVLLDKAVEYIVYPSAKPCYKHLPYKCNAVKEAVLFCQYPNPVVANSEYMDLPGAGEIAPDVEKRYAEGFDLSTDMVLFVGPYNTTPYGDKAARMVDILGGVVPGGQLDNYMLYFQNDFHQVDGLEAKLCRALVINKGAHAPIYAVIGRGADAKIYRLEAGLENPPKDFESIIVSEIGTDGRVVVFGEGNDADYVTGTLVPFICAHAAARLPLLDAALVESAKAKCNAIAETSRDLISDVQKKLNAILLGLPAKENVFVNEVNNRVEELRVAIEEIRQAVRRDYKSRKLLVPADSAKTPGGIQAQLLREIDAPESGLLLNSDKESVVRALRQSIARTNGIGGAEERAVRSLRVAVTERFAVLEDTYAELIQKLQQSIFAGIRDADSPDAGRGVPFLSDGDGESLIEKWISLLEKAGCPALCAAARDFAALRVPFYLTVYPDIRKAVFSRTDHEVSLEEFAGTKDPAEIYERLRDVAHDWARDTGSTISSRDAAREIVFSAIERFVDRTLSPETDGELHVFAQYYWSRFAKKTASPDEILRERFESLRKMIDELQGEAW